MKSIWRPWIGLTMGLCLPLLATGAVEVVEGELGPGAKYAMFMPDTWNGELVLYAHGFIDPAAPLALPTADYIEPFRDHLLSEGYAVAYSSYSQNGLAIQDGVQRTMQLRGRFVAEFEKPGRVYLVGHSLGGLVCVNLAEKHARQYDGVLSIAGMLGGSQASVDYAFHLRVLFEFFYPGVLPGTAREIPPDLDVVTDVVIPVVTAISTDPSGAGAIAMIDQTPVPFRNGPELVQSFYRGLGFFFRGFEDVDERTHGHGAFDNWHTEYTGLLPPIYLAGVNAGVERYQAGPDAANYLLHHYAPSGKLDIPVLTLHNRYDPSVPIFHEEHFAQAVYANGNPNRLVQRVWDRYGHTEAIPVADLVQGFLDLAAWVQTGVPPAP